MQCTVHRLPGLVLRFERSHFAFIFSVWILIPLDNLVSMPHAAMLYKKNTRINRIMGNIKQRGKICSLFRISTFILHTGLSAQKTKHVCKHPRKTYLCWSRSFFLQTAWGGWNYQRSSFFPPALFSPDAEQGAHSSKSRSPQWGMRGEGEENTWRTEQGQFPLLPSVSQGPFHILHHVSAPSFPAFVSYFLTLDFHLPSSKQSQRW